MNGIKQFRKNKQGFLLVDAMIGVLVVAIGLAALAALYTYGIGVMVSADRQEKAVQIASEKIELLKAADGHSSSDIEDLMMDNIGTDPEKAKSVEIDDIKFYFWGTGRFLQDNNSTGVNQLYYVKVFVKWSDPRIQTISLETYIRTNPYKRLI